jgi:hypothetical protein
MQAAACQRPAPVCSSRPPAGSCMPAQLKQQQCASSAAQGSGTRCVHVLCRAVLCAVSQHHHMAVGPWADAPMRAGTWLLSYAPVPNRLLLRRTSNLACSLFCVLGSLQPQHVVVCWADDHMHAGMHIAHTIPSCTIADQTRTLLVTNVTAVFAMCPTAPSHCGGLLGRRPHV